MERQADRSFKIKEGWIEVPKSDATVQKMVDLVATKRELELFQKGQLLFITKKGREVWNCHIIHTHKLN